MALPNNSRAQTLTISDQEFEGGGRSSSGGNARGVAITIIHAKISALDFRTRLAGASALSKAAVQSFIATASDPPAALNPGDAGSRGREIKAESGAFDVCACAIATPSVTINAMAIAAGAHLRTIISGLHRSLRKATTCEICQNLTYGRGRKKGSMWPDTRRNLEWLFSISG